MRWESQDRDVVAIERKQEIRTVLQRYADQNGIQLDLDGGSPLKLALRTGDHWVSYAGGVSSATGKV